MKKTLLLILALWFAIGAAKAQNANIDFIPFHYPGYDIFQYDNKPLQQRDGDMIVNVCVGIPNEDPHYSPYVLGNTFYKVSPTGLQILDTMFVADSMPPWYLFAQDPLGPGNLRANIEPDENGGTALRISHFSDDDMTINHDEDVVVHLHDSSNWSSMDCYMMDSQGDLILKYYSMSSMNTVCHISRCGADGTVKYTTDLPSSQNYIWTLDEIGNEPKHYYQWKNDNNGDLYIYYLDSTFQVTKQNIINSLLFDHLYAIVGEDTVYMQVQIEFRFGDSNSNSTFVVIDGNDLLVAAPYDYDSGWVYDYSECGAAIARYNRNNLHMEALAYFNDQPGPSTDARIMSFQKTIDGDFYLVYREPTPYPEYVTTMTAVKMDRDLNVIWKRYCYEPYSFKLDPYWSDYSDVLYDAYGNETGIYYVGTSYRPEYQCNGLCFFFLTEEGLTIKENGLEVRPYTYYPNPAQNELRLNYSPDVTPAQIELYDMQGRLVKTQRSGLESIRLQGLPAGTYTMRVTLENGKVFSDKVIKE